MQRLATVGVYGASLEGFLDALAVAGVDMVLDVRQRRGVRGREYSWANSLRLQSAMASAGIAYRHVPGLAPSTELRQLQYREDALQGVGKRNREVLAPEYRGRYIREILDRFDIGGLVAELGDICCLALLCVERDVRACHRSLVAARIHELFGLPVQHLARRLATVMRALRAQARARRNARAIGGRAGGRW